MEAPYINLAGASLSARAISHSGRYLKGSNNGRPLWIVSGIVRDNLRPAKPVSASDLLDTPIGRCYNRPIPRESHLAWPFCVILGSPDV